MHKSYIKAKKGDLVIIHKFKGYPRYNRIGVTITDMEYITYGDLNVQLFKLKGGGESYTCPHWQIINFC